MNGKLPLAGSAAADSAEDADCSVGFMTQPSLYEGARASRKMGTVA
jgi:hypothetical protein